MAALKETEQQLLDVEEVASTNQQKGVTGGIDDHDKKKPHLPAASESGVEVTVHQVR